MDTKGSKDQVGSLRSQIESQSQLPLPCRSGGTLTLTGARSRLPYSSGPALDAVLIPKHHTHENPILVQELKSTFREAGRLKINPQKGRDDLIGHPLQQTTA